MVVYGGGTRLSSRQCLAAMEESSRLVVAMAASAAWRCHATFLCTRAVWRLALCSPSRPRGRARASSSPSSSGSGPAWRPQTCRAHDGRGRRRLWSSSRWRARPSRCRLPDRSQAAARRAPSRRSSPTSRRPSPGAHGPSSVPKGVPSTTPGARRHRRRGGAGASRSRGSSFKEKPFFVYWSEGFARCSDLNLGRPRLLVTATRFFMSERAFARAFPKSRTTWCWGTEEPSASHSCSPLHPVSSSSSSAGPHVTLCSGVEAS